MQGAANKCGIASGITSICHPRNSSPCVNCAGGHFCSCGIVLLQCYLARQDIANGYREHTQSQSTIYPWTPVQIQGFVQCHYPASISSSSFGLVTAGALPGASWALACYRGFGDLSDVSMVHVMERTTAEPRPTLATHQIQTCLPLGTTLAFGTCTSHFQEFCLPS